MAPTNKEGASAHDIGAEFEENDTPQKVIVNTKPRVTKPEFLRNQTDERAAETSDRPTPSEADVKARSNTLKPDVSQEAVKTEAEPKNNDAALVNELATAAADKKSAKDNTVDADKQNHIDELVAGKNYFVPIGQVTKRRNTKIIVILLVLIMLAAGTAAFMFM